MATFNIITGILLVIALTVATWWAFCNWRERQLNKIIASDLTSLYAQVSDRASATQSKKSAERKNFNPSAAADKAELLDSPEMLATLVTVMINKYGDTRLSLNDFVIGDDKYVSVYVDNATQEILLSLDNDLVNNSYEDALIGFANGNTDDKTFH